MTLRNAFGDLALDATVSAVLAKLDNGLEITNTSPVPVEAQGELLEAIESLRMSVHSLSRSIGMSLPDIGGRLRVVSDTASSLGTVSSLLNQTSIGGYAANSQVPALMQMSANDLRRNITVS